MREHPGQKLRQAIKAEKPLQLPGVINAYAAKLAQSVGFKALYLSGAGVANANFALPDLAMTSLNDVLGTVQQIVNATDLPLVVDADTGWGSPLNVKRTFQMLSQAGAAGAHIEDQTEAKRCGHRQGKQLVSAIEMVTKIKAALDGREHDSFLVMARTDAFAVEGEKGALERALMYQAAGADALFIEALTSLEQYAVFTKALSIPVLANITEFGKTPLYTKAELAKQGVAIVLYPLSAFRAMNAAALKVYKAIYEQGTQQSVVDLMQNRNELYQFLNYEQFEKELDNYNQLMEHEHGSK
ncbi:MAG: methylisocitrate lyase [Proteobacteria bacterium]|nr:methylisocitrate lyase [Pseudomonadota bacterium]